MKDQRDYFVEKLKLSSAVDNIDVTLTYTRNDGWNALYIKA
ncbi:MAG: hypothetical protein ACE5J9_05485 [Methanosarcinales archaeon]